MAHARTNCRDSRSQKLHTNALMGAKEIKRFFAVKKDA